MTTRHGLPSIEAIQEDSSEDEVDRHSGHRGDDGSDSDSQHRQPPAIMAPTKASTGRERERPRKPRRSSASGGRHANKPRTKNTSVKRISARDNASDSSRPRHRRSHSSRERGSSTSSSSDDEEQPIQDHRAILAAARARLTSPSTISSLTALTTTTNKSSGSSGSNSTVTQASITKRTSTAKKAGEDQAPMSPAVPDPPDVFAFLDNSSTLTLTKDGGEAEDESSNDEGADNPPRWMPGHLADDDEESANPVHASQDASASSSAASSFHGDDNFSEPAAEADQDTDRSTSPERSVHGQDEEAAAPSDETSAKIASQMAAAEQRQNLHAYGTPNMQRGSATHPHVPSITLSSRYQQQMKQRLPRAEKLPVTGYELLASQLSSHDKIKPMYRKFEALNHRLLLHLQDEISELEEQLHRLDNADTQTRRTERHIVPASRRAAAAAGGELQWHKTDILGRIGYKLAQYNQALASFNTTQALSPPDPNDISTYRDYLQNAHPIAEVETHFLDRADDLVSVYSENVAPPSSSSLSSYTPSHTSASSCSPSTVIPHPKQIAPSKAESILQSHSTGLAIGLAVAVLIPILTFAVIPGFLGRLTVTSLVAAGVLGAELQGGVVERNIVLANEGLMCAGIYGAVMIVVAGIMPG